MSSRFTDERLPMDKIALADTRPIIIFGMPFLWLLISLFGPAILAVFTIMIGYPNPWLFILAVPMCMSGRMIVAKDCNRPRILYLWIKTGKAFAYHKKGKGEILPILSTVRNQWGGYLHD